MRPLGDGFIKLIKMMIAPIVFCTIVAGIGKMADMKGVGSIGLKALIYFEVVSTLALLIGLVVGLIVRPGAGIHASAADARSVGGEAYVAESQIAAHDRLPPQHHPRPPSSRRSPAAKSCRCCWCRCCSGSRMLQLGAARAAAR